MNFNFIFNKSFEIQILQYWVLTTKFQNSLTTPLFDRFRLNDQQKLQMDYKFDSHNNNFEFESISEFRSTLPSVL